MKFLICLLCLFLWGVLGEIEDPSVTRFQEYLRINTAPPYPNYERGIYWLWEQAEEIGLDFHLERYDDGMFAVWMTWNGSNPSLSSILINSHMDVVAAEPEDKWTHPPFAAIKDTNGTIWGRGTVDMKSATVAALESIRSLKASGFIPLRTLHVSVLPDEELFQRGVKAFIASPSFQSLNVGFGIDEGVPSGPDTQNIYVAYTEKSIWQFNVTVFGRSGHSANLPEITAGQKLQKVIDKLMDFRQTQVQLVKKGTHTLENVTSLNLVSLGGGLGNNVIPDELWASFDLRTVLKPGWTSAEVEKMLNSIAEESGNDTIVTYIKVVTESATTPTDSTNPWWVVLQESCDQLNSTCIPSIPNGVSDGRYIRNSGIPVFGINLFPFTEALHHQNNENINETSFLAGIQRFTFVIKNFLSVPDANRQVTGHCRSRAFYGPERSFESELLVQMYGNQVLHADSYLLNAVFHLFQKVVV